MDLEQGVYGLILSEAKATERLLLSLDSKPRYSIDSDGAFFHPHLACRALGRTLGFNNGRRFIALDWLLAGLRHVVDEGQHVQHLAEYGLLSQVRIKPSSDINGVFESL